MDVSLFGNGNNFNYYYYNDLALTTSVQTYTLDYTCSDAGVNSEPNFSLVFYLAKGVISDIWIDQVTVQDITTVVNVASVSLSPSPLNLLTGQKGQLTKTITPANASNQNVSWASANPAIATVNSSGSVTAVAAGTTTITVTTADGNKTSQVTVNVTTPPTSYSTRLNGTINEKYGLAKSLSVMPGDIITTEVYAKYLDTNSNNWNAALANLINAIAAGTAPAGTFIDGGAPGSTGGIPAPWPTPSRTGDTGIGPKAYLNYLVFDKKGVLKTGGFKRLSATPVEDGTDVPHERLAFDGVEQITITEPGYVLIYLSNENDTPVEVYFDDFKVDHIKGPIVSSQDYYPFGLAFNTNQKENSIQQPYQYNGKEIQDELNLQWLDYGARMYQPEIGRWIGIDKRSHNYMTYSPYGYVANNPVNNVDYNGEFILPKEFLNRFQRIAQYLANDIQGILNNKRVVSALKRHGGFSDEQLKQVFTWGQGPTVKPSSDLGPINIKKPVLGMTGGVKGLPAYLSINIELFEALEKAEDKDRDYWLFLIATTILHETVHYGYIQNGLTTPTPEEGNDFEKDAYGELVKMNNYRQILDRWQENRRLPQSSLLKSGFGSGIPWAAPSAGDGSAPNKNSKKKPDADREAAERSGGAY